MRIFIMPVGDVEAKRSAEMPPIIVNLLAGIAVAAASLGDMVQDIVAERAGRSVQTSAFPKGEVVAFGLFIDRFQHAQGECQIVHACPRFRMVRRT